MILSVIFENVPAERALRLNGGLQSQLVSILLPPGSAAQIRAILLSLAIRILYKNRSTLFALISIVILPFDLIWLDSHSQAY